MATLGGFGRSRAASPPMRTTNPTKRVGLKSHSDGPGMPFANKGLAKASPKAVTAAPERASSSNATAVPASQSALALGSWLLARGKADTRRKDCAGEVLPGDLQALTSAPHSQPTAGAGLTAGSPLSSRNSRTESGW